MMKKKRYLGILFSILMICGIVFQGMNTLAYAKEENESQNVNSEVDAKITDFQILSLSNVPVSEIEKSTTLQLKFDFEVPEPIILKSGNYFDVDIPNTIDLSTAATHPLIFNLTDEDGVTVVAKATIQPNAATTTDGGGKVRIEFNENAIGKYKFKGTFHFDAKVNTKKVEDNETIHVKTKVNNHEYLTPDPKDLKIKPDKPLSTIEIIGKWGKSPKLPDVAEWGVRINRTKQNLSHVVITDKLLSGNGHYLDPSPMPEVKTTEQFKLLKTDFDALGNVLNWSGEVIDISDKITFNADKTEFRLDLGNIGTDSFFLSYKSTVENGDIVQNNEATITSDTYPSQTSSGTWKYHSAGGSAVGVYAKRLRIRKVDYDDGSPLAGATFRVTSQVAGHIGESFYLTTNAEGIAASEQLLQGRYKIKETIAPTGYELDPIEHSIYVYDDIGGTLTVKDKMDKISVKVKKKWIGKQGDFATIHLYADDIDTGKSVILNENNNWSHTFEGLKQKNGDGNLIKYTVKEETVTNYESTVAGDAVNGFTITNTNSEKISIPVEKKWIGKEKDAVTVQLFADKKDTGKTIILNAGEQWKGRFSNLLKYDSKDGHEIIYTIKEVKVGGYNSVISGTVKDGFTITNTITGKVSVPVTKIWIGKESMSAAIYIYADGEKVGSTILNAGNGWQHTFSNLEKYKDGKEIKYTIKEEDIENYKSEISGDADSGFMVKNTNIEKISIPVTKKWVGMMTNQVKVRLLADNKVKEIATLTADGNWKHIFKDLPKYDDVDGHEIIYTITEAKVDGYTTTITGDSRKGFVITNTKDMPKIPNKPSKKKITTPKTLDNSKLSFYGGMMIVSLGVLLFLINRKRKQA